MIKPNLPASIDARGNPDQNRAGELGAGAVRMQPESMAPAERIPGALPLSPHIHPSGGLGGTIKGAEPPPIAQIGMGSAANGEAWFPDHPSTLSAGMPHGSRAERNAAMAGIERAHLDTATTLPDERRDQGSASASPPPSPETGSGTPTNFRPGAAMDTRLSLAPGADEFPPGGEKGFGAISPMGTEGDLPAAYGGTEWSERQHGRVAGTDLPDHFHPQDMARDAERLGMGEKNFSMFSPPGTHGDDPARYPLPGTATGQPEHGALSGLPQSISPEDFAKAALGGEYGTAWPPGLNGDKR